MMRPILTDPELWRVQACGLRRSARLMHDHATKTRMLRMADAYDALVRDVEKTNRAPQQLPPAARRRSMTAPTQLTSD